MTARLCPCGAATRTARAKKCAECKRQQKNAKQREHYMTVLKMDEAWYERHCQNGAKYYRQKRYGVSA